MPIEQVVSSVAKRLAAAKANPQLAKTLDAGSGLADNYSMLGVLGKGSYGEVRLAIHKLTRRRVAVKTILRAKLSDAKLRKRAEVVAAEMVGSGEMRGTAELECIEMRGTVALEWIDERGCEVVWWQLCPGLLHWAAPPLLVRAFDVTARA